MLQTFETLQLSDQETLKSRNQTILHQETKKQKSHDNELFHFQVTESPAPLNIPTPTPAPDHPLGGHERAWGTRVLGGISIIIGDYLIN